jgi:hypothetical protein
LIYKGGYFMRKARIALAAIALLALAGGAVAFKAARFTGSPVFGTTTVYFSNGIAYTRAAGATFIGTLTSLYVTPVAPGVLSTVATTLPTTASITLTRVGGSQTIAIPAWPTTTTTTLVTTAD